MKRLSILFVFAFAVVCVNAQLLYDILDGKYRSQLPEMPSIVTGKQIGRAHV